MLLIRLNFHQLAIDRSDSAVQHFHFLVQVFCCTDHADASRVELFMQEFSEDLELNFCCRSHKSVSMAESIHKL